MRKLKPRQRLEIALSFALMLELMNACENAYRTWRLRSSPRFKLARRPRAIIYVLTAHPTESRSPETIALFHEIQRALLQWLDEPPVLRGRNPRQASAHDRLAAFALAKA